MRLLDTSSHAPALFASASRERLTLLFPGLALFCLFCGKFWWPGTDTSLDACIRILLLCALIASLWFRRRPVLDGRACIFLLFWLTLFLNASFLGDGQATRRLLVLLVFVYACAPILTDFRAMRLLLMPTAGFITLCALFSLYYYAEFKDLSFAYRATPLEGSGVAGFANFGNSDIAGTSYVPALIFSAWLTLSSPKRNAILLWGICTLSIATLIFFTWSRTAWLSSGIAVALLVACLAPARFRKMAASLATLALVAFALLKYPLLLEMTTGRGLTHRDIIWKSILERMPGYWLIGHGGGANLGCFKMPGGNELCHAHNLYMEVLYQYGVTGVILMVVTGLALLGKLFRLRQNPLVALWLALLAAGLLAIMFSMSNFIGAPNRIWIFYWLPIAAALAFSLPAVRKTKVPQDAK